MVTRPSPEDPSGFQPSTCLESSHLTFAVGGPMRIGILRHGSSRISISSASCWGCSWSFVDREVSLGRFRADIVARDVLGRTVVIENQFGPSDHKHFGQIVLYACEARADVVAWLVARTCKPRVMTPFRSQHRKALQRLNSVFAGATDFFGVQLTLESDPQPAGAPTLPILPRLSVAVSANHRPTQQS